MLMKALLSRDHQREELIAVAPRLMNDVRSKNTSSPTLRLVGRNLSLAEEFFSQRLDRVEIGVVEVAIALGGGEILNNPPPRGINSSIRSGVSCRRGLKRLAYARGTWSGTPCLKLTNRRPRPPCSKG